MYNILQEQKRKHNNFTCKNLTTHMKNVVNEGDDVNKPIRKMITFGNFNDRTHIQLYNYNTQCVEFQEFMDEVNKSNRVGIVCKGNSVNSISTKFDGEKKIYVLH